MSFGPEFRGNCVRYMDVYDAISSHGSPSGRRGIFPDNTSVAGMSLLTHKTVPKLRHREYVARQEFGDLSIAFRPRLAIVNASG